MLNKALRLLDKTSVQMLLIVASGILVYSNTLHVPFQEDARFIVDNSFVKDMSYPLRLLKENATLYSHLMHRYVGFVTFGINYRLHGLELPGYHLVNIAIHLLNALLVRKLVIGLMRTPLLAGRAAGYEGCAPLMAALLFVVHPLQTEPVNFIWQRISILVTLFYLGSVVAYIMSRLPEQPRLKKWILYGVSFVSALLAMKTKQNAFTLPFIILFCELYFFPGTLRSRLLSLVPFTVPVAVIPATYLFLMKSGLGQATRGEESGIFGNYARIDYLLTQFTVISRYVRLLIFPTGQQFSYLNYPLYQSFLDFRVAGSFVFLSTLVVGSIYVLKRYRHNDPALVMAAFGMLWFFGTISIESSIFPIAILAAEYRIYLPSAGFLMSLALLASRLSGRLPYPRNTYFAGGCVVALIVFGFSAHMRNEVWRTEISLKEDNVRKMPDYPFAHYFLAEAYKNAGMKDEAAREYEIASKLDEQQHPKGMVKRIIAPDRAMMRKLEQDVQSGNASSYFDLALGYYLNRRYDEAMHALDEVLRINPKHAGALYYRGLVHHILGRIPEAISEYRAVLELEPDNVEVRTSLGAAVAGQGKLEEAAVELKDALRRNPDYAEAYQWLGMVYQDQGRLQDAAVALKKAVALGPDSVQAYVALGDVLLVINNDMEAYRAFRNALDLDPSLDYARNRMKEILDRTAGGK